LPKSKASGSVYDLSALQRYIPHRPRIHRPDKTMFQLIPFNALPLRYQRWCCRILKERGGEGRTVITGIRKQESIERSKRNQYENDDDLLKTFCHVIFDWKSRDVWDYIKSNNLPYCKLYDEGWERIGCIGCPYATAQQKKMQFDRFPNIKKAYLWAINKMMERKPDKYFGTDAELCFEWWVSGLSPRKFLGLRENTEIEI